ncbi:MAG: SDR family NAD(P)-dependent oxidoreductase [Bacteroidales bacterium]|nr:SDR family NAD(P)-dependent oxidoreductase [Bacteroidales bacterium]
MKAIIMGATSGIGQAVMLELTRRGWEVGIAGRRQEQLIELQRTNLNVIATQRIDITHPDAAEQLRTLIGKMGGDIDLYFHSSGIGYQNPSLDIDKELRTVETNALGFTRMVTAAYHYFLQHPERPGHIAVISSIAGTRPLGTAPAYSATKRYINHYMDCLRQLRRIHGVRHLCLTDIRPGFVRTPLLANGGNYPMQLDVTHVAKEIVDGLERRKSVITVDWKYRLLVFFWRLIPRFIWLRLKIASKK